MMTDAERRQDPLPTGSLAREHSGGPPRPNYVGMAFLVFLAVLGIAYVAMSLSYGLSAETNPLGPGAAPAALGILLVVGCLVLLMQEVRTHRKAAAAAAQGIAPTEVAEPGVRDLVKPVLILLIVVAGLMLTPVVGMMIAMPLVVLAIALFVEKLKPVPALIMAAVTALMLWLVFQQLLSIRFPTNLIGL
ncbi:tripartite tricarboxylate transporter TctB family protein [Citricoccus alkalitolerans]|uniref:Tripartite tricarboxylate transporter TctB family protein n=1 Tax=Citricoccus alkalitolerans TaxID=246603 RepID=A0ABV8XWA8_9MICC